LVSSILVALLSGKGPVFETTECPGLLQIPFQLWRFRARGAATRDSTALRELLPRLRPVNLPRLPYVLRGEIALFGPSPVRREFAERLTELIPYYFHRFSVRPGIFGWAQLHLRGVHPQPEQLRLEYDFYYIRHASLVLDLEILLRTLL